VRHGGYDVVVLDTWDRLAASEPDSLGVLGMLDRAGVRVLMVAEGVDTGDPIGRDLVVSLLDPAAPRQPVLV
jgi:DNA invertase Pin-like site-specific DNA recombinase